jgi:hypothetical protein
MPANWADTPAKERAWDRAKARVRDQYPDVSEDSERFYKLTMSIAQNMAGEKSAALRRALLAKCAYRDAAEDLGFDQMEGGAGDTVDLREHDPESLLWGAQHELEHTSDVFKALEIAGDHLSEDASYYDDWDEEDEEENGKEKLSAKKEECEDEDDEEDDGDEDDEEDEDEEKEAGEKRAIEGMEYGMLANTMTAAATAGASRMPTPMATPRPSGMVTTPKTSAPMPAPAAPSAGPAGVKMGAAQARLLFRGTLGKAVKPAVSTSAADEMVRRQSVREKIKKIMAPIMKPPLVNPSGVGEQTRLFTKMNSLAHAHGFMVKLYERLSA